MYGLLRSVSSPSSSPPSFREDVVDVLALILILQLLPTGWLGGSSEEESRDPLVYITDESRSMFSFLRRPCLLLDS